MMACISNVCQANTAVIKNGEIIDIDEVRKELEEMEASVAVAVIIQNHSRFKLKLEQVDITCGVFSNNTGSIQEELWPGQADIVMMEKVKPFTMVLLSTP